ncbi:Heterochromatin protein 1 [Armadillidium nasatum]|uniref:Heterochromatin protein 1 n=1 Tax=Armadillidium nasatum TaxID=96803 RepID=A0A5N5SN96_9CRUS|nr:Heterochromatin protein 1 [Armadillidium nasatum]
MRSLRGGKPKSQKKNSENSENNESEAKAIDDDVGANGDETTDDEGGVDTPPPPVEDDDDSKEEKMETNETKEKDSKDTKGKKGSKNKKKDDDDGEYEVEQVVDMNVNPRKKCPVYFRVRWKGFTEKDDSWIPVSDLNCEEVVQDFLEISGRKPEYERALEAKKKSLEIFENCRQSSRKATKITYSELDEDQDEILPSGTRSRKVKTKAEKKQMPVMSPPKKKKKVTPAPRGVPPKQEHFEVERIVDHRVKGKYTEYKIRWKGFGPQEDVWLDEGDLNCPKLIKTYKKNPKVKNEPEEETYEC